MFILKSLFNSSGLVALTLFLVGWYYVEPAYTFFVLFAAIAVALYVTQEVEDADAED